MSNVKPADEIERMNPSTNSTPPVSSGSSSSEQGGDSPPELPPRPPTLLSLSPRPLPPHAPAYQSPTSPNTPGSAVVSGNVNHTCGRSPWYGVMFQKYVLLTVISGTLSVILGSLFITLYFIVRNTTTSLHYFETLPTYIPGIAMTLTGFMVMMFSKTNNRKSCLVKICGCLCLLSALLCVVVTVTTTVVHMNRLQTLRECVYQASTKTCTCFAGIMDHRSLDHDAALRYVFAAAPNCEVIHGTIYTCLRAMFGLSVIGILVSIFSCMLVYQILSHEKKKKYLAELNSRCRGLYQRPGLGQSNLSQFGHHQSQSQMCQYPWLMNNRLCSGNLYTPTPELSISTISTTLSGAAPPPSRQEAEGGAGAWRWLPWSRKHPTSSTTPSTTGAGGGIVHSHSDNLTSAAAAGQLRSRGGQLGPVRPPQWRYSHSDAIYGFRPPAAPSLASTMSSYNMTGHYGGRLDLTNIDSLSNLLWGPPPPYSQPSSTSGADLSPGGHQPASDQGASPHNQESPVRSQSRMSRTTKSGILIENGGANTNEGGNPSPIHYDDTVDSAMHIYEKLRRSRSGSLPSRRVKKTRKSVAASSSNNNLINSTAADLTPLQLNQNLSALNLSRAEEMRTAKDLEEIKRALIALQQNSLGILNNIQYDNSLYSKGNNIASGEFQQKIEFSRQRQENVIPTINQAQPNPSHHHKQKKTRGAGVVYSVSNDHISAPSPSRNSTGVPTKFSLTPGGRKTISTTNLISSGTDSDNSYGVSGSVSIGSRASSNLSSPTNLALSSYFTNQVQMQQKNKSASSLTSPNFSLKPVHESNKTITGAGQVIKTQELPHINSSIIQTANQKLMNLQTTNSVHPGGKLPLSLSGLLSPRHNVTPNVPLMSPSALNPPPPPVRPSLAHLTGLISPARMYPTNFSPQSVPSSASPTSTPPGPPPPPAKPGLVYLRQDQNIPENFCDKFRPIEPATTAGDKLGGDLADKTDFVDIKNISSDDIVVTLHSVNV